MGQIIKTDTILKSKSIQYEICIHHKIEVIENYYHNSTHIVLIIEWILTSRSILKS